MIKPPIITHEIRSEIETIEKNPALYEEKNFDDRMEAISDIEFNVIDRIDGLLQTISPPEGLTYLKQYAEKVKRRLENVDDNLFQRLRADIRRGDCKGTALKELIDEYVGRYSSDSRRQDEVGYDSLDMFINGLLLAEALPAETKSREPEMLYYQQTPARIIFELVEKAHLAEGDVFYDLGSGLGQVQILVNLLSGAAAKGIEFEPAYCNYASACAADLNLSRVEFFNADARRMDYSEGTVFFMYTPFDGGILQEVLEKLRGESQTRSIRVFTYGPCTRQVSQQNWLKCADPNGVHVNALGVFSSLGPHS